MFVLKNRFLSVTLAFALLMELLILQSFSITYSDTGNHWAEKDIQRLSEWGIITGSNGYFKPNQPVTRAEMAIFLDRIMHYQKESAQEFSDLKEFFEKTSVLKAYSAGVLEVDGDSIFPMNRSAGKTASSCWQRLSVLEKSIFIRVLLPISKIFHTGILGILTQ
jgi:hypothetical protein